MRVITQEEFDNFEIVNGIKKCPSGDYSNIKSFGERCRFGEWCRFGERCSFGEATMIESKYNLIHMKKIDCIGSRNGCTYFFKCEEGIIVRCGCFLGTLEEFETKVKITYKDIEKYYKEYIGAITYIKSIMED